jgi:hypothetical protein
MWHRCPDRLKFWIVTARGWPGRLEILGIPAIPANPDYRPGIRVFEIRMLL